MKIINDDCLRQIFQHLELKDVVNLAAGYRRLRNFSETFIFPKIAKEIGMEVSNEPNRASFTIAAPSDNACTWELSPKSSEIASYFGLWLKSLTIEYYYANAEIWRSSEIIMNLCRNVTKLGFAKLCFSPDQTRELQDLIERFESLTDFYFSECTGTTNNWHAPKCISKVDKLTFSANDKLAGHFFGYFRNLSSLTIDFSRNCVWRTGAISNIFDNIGHSLKSFELANLSNSSYAHRSLNSILRALSNYGIIEFILVGADFCFQYDDINAPPLRFNKLRELCLFGVSGVLKAMARWQMPEIQEISVHTVFEELHELLSFVQSKNTLNKIYLNLFDDGAPSVFLYHLIGVLKESCTPKRPILTLEIADNLLDEEEVSRVIFLDQIFKLSHIFNSITDKVARFKSTSDQS